MVKLRLLQKQNQKGDYSKLTEEGKEYDRRTVRAVLDAIQEV
jgi:hypothetical protein